MFFHKHLCETTMKLTCIKDSSVLLSLQTGVQGTGLGEILHQLLLVSLAELAALRLGVHPLRLETDRSDRLALLAARETNHVGSLCRLTAVYCGCWVVLNQQYW